MVLHDPLARSSRNVKLILIEDGNRKLSILHIDEHPKSAYNRGDLTKPDRYQKKEGGEL